MLEFRKYSLEYLTEFTSIKNDPDVLKYGYDKYPYPFTIENANEIISQELIKQPAERFLIFWNNHLAGEIGIRPGEDIFRLNAEIGFFIAKSFWGKGIASLAIGKMTSYVFDNFNVTRINAGVMEPNKASMKVLEKNGYILEYKREKSVIKNEKIMTNYHWVKFKNANL